MEGLLQGSVSASQWYDRLASYPMLFPAVGLARCKYQSSLKTARREAGTLIYMVGREVGRECRWQMWVR